MIDSNVLVAVAALDHDHHKSSLAFIEAYSIGRLATANHCLSEFVSIVTRVYKIGATPFTPQQTMVALGQYVDQLDILSLSQDEHIQGIRQFLARKGVGPRLYDYMIGRVAEINDIPLIITWNVKHFIPLFPTLRIATPEDLLQET